MTISSQLLQPRVWYPTLQTRLQFSASCLVDSDATRRDGSWSSLSWGPENLIHTYLTNDVVYVEQTEIVARRMTTPCLPERYNRLLYVYLCVNESHPGCHGYRSPWIRQCRGLKRASREPHAARQFCGPFTDPSQCQSYSF